LPIVCVSPEREVASHEIHPFALLYSGFVFLASAIAAADGEAYPTPSSMIIISEKLYPFKYFSGGLIYHKLILE
jgi:hypothetical protein